VRSADDDMADSQLSRSRTHKARQLVDEVRLLRADVELARQLARTDDEQRWCLEAAFALDYLIRSGEAALCGVTVRKHEHGKDDL